MLYKVTPMMTPVEPKKAKAPVDPNAPPKEARKRRKSAVYDADGNEVLITMMCLKCKAMKPLTMFGLRKMADGAIRNQPWCRTCRSGAGTKKDKKVEIEAEVESTPEAIAPVEVQVVAAPAEPKDESKALIEQLLNGPAPA
ncbi:MAG: hypothetical protein U0228_29615 [Myxococcaceae bacterium]